MSKQEESTEAYHRGIAQAFLKEYQKAIAEFDRAIQLNPDYAEAYCQRGITNLRVQGSDPFNSIEDLYYALALNPNVDGAAQAKMLLEGFMGNDYWRKTKDYVEKIMAIYPEKAPPSLMYKK